MLVFFFKHKPVDLEAVTGGPVVPVEDVGLCAVKVFILPPLEGPYTAEQKKNEAQFTAAFVGPVILSPSPKHHTVGDLMSGTMSSISRPPLVVAVDLDEVLGLFVETLARFHNEVYGGSLTADDFHSYDFVHVWGGTREEANAKVLAFFKSSHFQEDLPPIRDAFPVLKALKDEGVDFHVVTSRQFCIQRETEEWVQKHYPGIFTGLHYGNHYSATGPQRSKGDMCQAIKAQLLVDDSLRYAHQVAQDAGIPVLLFGDYAWNQADPSLPPSSLPPSITRVTRWEDVRVHIEALLASHRQQHRERGGGET